MREMTGSALLVMEHDMPLLSGLADRTVALDLGSVIAYQWYREPTLPAPMTYTKQEELPERGYANEGRDILQEALEGRFGLARRYEGQTE